MREKCSEEPFLAWIMIWSKIRAENEHTTEMSLKFCQPARGIGNKLRRKSNQTMNPWTIIERFSVSTTIIIIVALWHGKN